jgi:4-diphosphocytidyl-2-C-methyl-D-erythritol kinase
MFAGLGDRLEARLAAESALEVAGPMAAGVPTDQRNLVLRAAAAFGTAAAFRLEKHLPVAAGIGGGSSDAAAALRLLAGLTGRPVPGGTEALGADIPVCLLARAARMRGIGEIVEPLDGLPDLPCVLVNPRVEVPTRAVFAALAQKVNAPMAETIPQFGDLRAMAAWLADQRNDLEAPAMAMQPTIARVLARLQDCEGVLLARMSGSGATCFALFASDGAAAEAALLLRADQPGWWVAQTRLS